MATKKTTGKTVARGGKAAGGAAKAPHWSKLTHDQKRAVAARMLRAWNVAGRYRIVNPVGPSVRATGSVEHGSEDQVLDAYRRGRMLNLARDAARNSSTLNSILKQFDLQAVGTCGGKATFTLDGADALREKFAAWTRNADFFDGLNFNTLLKVLLKTYILGGDAVLLFDDQLIEDSGRLLIYEPDEIGDLEEGDFQRVYGANAHQSQGRVYNANGRFIGVIVSRACRGSAPFALEKSYTLTCDPNASVFDAKWMMPRNVFRVAQGRGVTPLAPSLSTVIDLEDLTEFELQAAKKNSQTLAQIVDTSEDAADPSLTSAFEPGTDFSGMTDAEIDAAVESEAEVQEEVVSLDQIRGAGVLYEQMPAKHKLELLDTKHPNANMPEFIRWLAGRAAAPFGLGSVYATLKADASYTAFRGEQVMSQPAFEEAQKFLEQVCDWVLYRWSVWATRKGVVAGALDALDLRSVQWQWPKMREVNQVDEQNAIALKLKNGTGSYRDIYGADWRRQLDQVAEEIAYCKEHGIVHPSAVTSSGGVIEEQVEHSSTIGHEGDEQDGDGDDEGDGDGDGEGDGK